jgi:thioredoxin-dependent peroxiredoxin
MKIIGIIGLLFALGLILWSRLSYAGEVPKAGEAAAPFTLPDQNGKSHALADYRGQWVVLYFYPKDDTPGCTQEACSFRDDLNLLKAMGAQVIGVSVDDSDSHAEFAKKYHLPFPLLADKNGEVAARYGALLNLKLIKFAKRYTFLITPEGRIARVYMKVETSRHSKEIIDDVQRLAKK